MDSGDDDPGSREPDDYWYPSPLLASWQLTGEWRPNGAAWPPSAPGRDPGPPTRNDRSGPAAPVVGPTAALRGRAGGPGFSVPGDPSTGDPGRSGWQVAQGVWHGSGIRWDEPSEPGFSAPPGHAEQTIASGAPRPEEFPGAQAFLSAPVLADAPPETYADGIVPGASMATEEASERYNAWQESVIEAVSSQGGRSAPLSDPRRGDQSPRAAQGSPAGSLGRVAGPAAVIVTVGAGALLMLTGRASHLMSEIPGNQASPAPQRPAPGGPPRAAGHPAVRPGRSGPGLASVAHGPAGWLAVGRVSAAGRPALFTSADKTAWRPLSAPGIVNAPGVDVTAVAASGHGYVVVGRQAEGSRRFAAMWWSPDLRTWTRAGNGGLDGRPASSQLNGVTAAGAGFVAAGTHAGHAAVWVTRTGLSWAPLSLPLPGGAASAALRFTAARGSTVVAAGEADTGHGTLPFVAMSRDDGEKWQQVTLPASGGGTVTALTASPAGFTAAGRAGGRPVRWTSPDGVTWTSATPSSSGS